MGRKYRWITKISDIAKDSPRVFEQLGKIIPKRLEGSAETWYYSLPADVRATNEVNWDSIRIAIASYYMNRKWLDRMKTKANRTCYRDFGHTKETPSEYYIRKTELLTTVYQMEDSELIMQVMDGAPATWNTILTTQSY